MLFNAESWWLGIRPGTAPVAFERLLWAVMDLPHPKLNERFEVKRHFLMSNFFSAFSAELYCLRAFFANQKSYPWGWRMFSLRRYMLDGRANHLIRRVPSAITLPRVVASLFHNTRRYWKSMVFSKLSSACSQCKPRCPAELLTFCPKNVHVIYSKLIDLFD